MIVSEKIDLKYPIKAKNGEEICILNVRRPKVRDLRTVHNKIESGISEADAETAILADLVQLSPSDFDELDAADMMQIREVYQSFFG